MPRINIELDKGLHKALRKKAIEEGVNMSEAIEKAIGMYLEGNGNGK